MLQNCLPFNARQYKPLLIFTPFFTTVYIVEQLVLQTIYALKILQFLDLKSAIYNWEWFLIKSGL